MLLPPLTSLLFRPSCPHVHHQYPSLPTSYPFPYSSPALQHGSPPSASHHPNTSCSSSPHTASPLLRAHHVHLVRAETLERQLGLPNYLVLGHLFPYRRRVDTPAQDRMQPHPKVHRRRASEKLPSIRPDGEVKAVGKSSSCYAEDESNWGRIQIGRPCWPRHPSLASW